MTDQWGTAKQADEPEPPTPPHGTRRPEPTGSAAPRPAPAQGNEPVGWAPSAGPPPWGFAGTATPGWPQAPGGHHPYPPASGFPPRPVTPPPSPPPPQRSRRRALLVLLVVLIAAGATATALVLQLRPGDDEGVRTAVQRLVYALDRHDAPALAAALCRQEAADVTEDDDFIADDVGAPTPAPPSPVEVRDIDVRGDVAAATLVRPGNPPTVLHLLREDGTWKVCAPAADRFARTPG
jgi:hypothetical protein